MYIKYQLLLRCYTGLHLGARVLDYCREIDVGWVPSFLSSFTSLVTLGFTRWQTTTSWNWSLLIDQSSVSLRRLPSLRHLELDLRHWMEGDDDALLGVLDAYGSTLTTLVLTLVPLHPVQRVARSSFACQQLESLALHMRYDESLTFTIEATSAFPSSTSLRRLQINLPEMTMAQVLVMVSACPALQSLSLRNNRRLSLALLPSLSQACRLLRSLTMSWVSASLFQAGLKQLSTFPAASLAPSNSGILFPWLVDLGLEATRHLRPLSQPDRCGGGPVARLHYIRYLCW